MMDKKTSMLQILDLFTHEQKISHHHSDFLKFLSSLSVPIITQDKINIFCKAFDETHDLLASLISFHDVFTFDPANLQKILLFNQAQNKEILKAAPFIYMNSIGFILSFNDVSTFNENFSIILNSIFSLSYYDFKNSFFLYFFILEYFIDCNSNLIQEDNVRLICSHLCIQTKPNIMFYHILIEMLNKVKACEKCLDQIFPTFSMVLQILSKKKLDIDISLLCEYIIQNLLNVKYQVFEVILALSKRKEDNNVKRIFELLPKSIKNFINNSPFEIVLDKSTDQNNTDEQYEYQFDDSLLSIQCDEILESDNYPEIYDCSEFPDTFFQHPIYTYLNLVVNVLPIDVKKSYLNAFMQNFEQLFTEPHDFNLFISFIFILSKIKCHYTLSSKMIDFLFNETIFNPAKTVFNSSIIDHQTIFLLRNVIIRITFQFNKYGASLFFKKSENWPFIFTEMLLRSVKFDMAKLFNDTFLNSFCKVYFELCSIDIQNKGEIKTVSKRPILYLFLKFLLEIPSLPYHELETFSKDTEKLINSIISEKSFKTTIFTQIKKYLYSTKYSDFNPSCNQVSNLLILINKSTEDPCAIKEYLQVYHDALSKNDCLKVSPSSVNNLLNSFITFIEHHPSEENALKILKILSFYSKEVIDNWVLHRLSVIIPIAIKELSDEVIFSLFQLIVQPSLNQPTLANSIIENGFFLHFIFSVFSNFNRIYDLLVIINDLCDYSCCNRIRLHKSEFDILLLDLLISYPNDFIFKECKIVNTNDDKYLDVLFEIFAKISITKSNQIVTNRLIKVICHSKISERFLKFLIPIENLTQKYAVSKYPLGIQQLYFEADNISEDMIKQGFSIAFWIFTDNPISEKLKIKSTVLTGMNFFNLTICQSSLYLSDVSNNVLLTFPIRSHHWNAVVLNFKDDSLVAYVNRNFVTRKIRLTTLNSKNTFTFGNDIENQSNDIDELLSVYSIAKFSMYTKELTLNEIERFISQTLELQPLFSFPSYPNNPPLQSAVMYIDMNGFIPKLENIIDSLNFTYPIENIIPLFSQLHNFEHRILILNSIENIFKNRFNSLSEIIMHLLNQNDRSIFNFQLYAVFYSFLKRPNEKEILFDSLIVNCDLWCYSAFDDLVKIVNHWKSVLFNEFDFFFYRKKFFSRFLSEIRVLNSALVNNSMIDLVIQPCLEIIELIANHDFDEYRLSIYLQTIIKSDNHELNGKMIQILPNLLKSLNSSQITLKIIELILSIDFDKYIDNFHSLIHSLSIVSGNKFYHSTIILGYNIQPEFDFVYFQNDLEQFPQLAFICLRAALKNSKENQKELGNLLIKIINNNEIPKMFLGFEMWFIWPVIFALQTGELEVMSFFIATVICADFSKENIGWIFSFIDLIGIQTSFNVKELKCSLIKNLYELLNADIRTQNNVELLELGFESLFTICTKKSISYQIENEFVNSPFNTNDYHIDDSSEISIYSLKDLKTILELDFANYSYFLQIMNISHFSKIVQSFYQIYTSLYLSVSESVSYLHKLICSLSSYPELEKNKEKDFLTFGTKLMPFVTSLRRRTQTFSTQMIDFFKRIEKPLQEIESLKNKMNDPLYEVYKEKENKFLINKKEWKRILKNYVHPNAVFDIDCFEWERDFFMTPDFVSNKLKRRIKALKQTHYRYPYHNINNNDNSKDNEGFLMLRRNASQNLPLKNSASKALSTSLISSYSCLLVKISKIKPVIFNLHSAKIEIIKKKKTINIKLNEIHDILTRSRFQKKTGIEFFLLNGKSYLFDFAPTSSSSVLKQFNGLSLPSLRSKENDDYSSFVDSLSIVQKWQIGSITTFDFLMQLNMFCGRSFHDSQNYVIFPWVIAFPESKHLRIFDRPMPAQTESRFNYYRKKIQLNQETPEMSNFLFGSAPSNAMLLSYYFVRVQPFTALHLKVHDGKFDVMDRIFRSVDAFFSGMAASDDSRESAPEFYSLPEIFFDLDKIDINMETCEEMEASNKQNREEKTANNEEQTTQQADELVNNQQKPEEKQQVDELNNNEQKAANEKPPAQQSEEQTDELNKNEQPNEEPTRTDELNNNEQPTPNEESTQQTDELNSTPATPIENPLETGEEQTAPKDGHEKAEQNENSAPHSEEQDTSPPSIEPAHKGNEQQTEQDSTPATANENQAEAREEQANESTALNQESAPQNEEPNMNHSMHEESANNEKGQRTETQEQDDGFHSQAANSSPQETGPSTIDHTQEAAEDNETPTAKTERDEEFQEEEEEISSPRSCNSGTQKEQRRDSQNDGEDSSTLNEDAVAANDESDSESDSQANGTASRSFNNDDESNSDDDDDDGDNITHEDFNIAHDIYDELPLPTSLSSSHLRLSESSSLASSSMSQAQQAAQSEFIGDLEVPEWSGNIYDFVYSLRRILESDELADQLNKWIDLIFGLSQRGDEATKRCNIYMPYIYDNVWKDKSPEDEEMVMALLRSLGSMPPLIFKEKVGPKVIIPNPIPMNKVFNLEYENQIKRGFPFMTSVNKCHLIAIDCQRNIERVSFDFNKSITSINSKDNFLNPSDHIITLYHKMAVYIIDCNNSKVSYVSIEKMMTQKVQNLENVEFIDPGIYEHTFFTISKTGSVYLWNSTKLDNPQLILSVFSDSLKAATVSQYFGVFVYATNNGFCEIYSLNNKRFVNSVYLDGFVGQKILITPKLGLIVVKTLKKIWVMTINGFVIKKVPFMHNLNIYTTWSSAKGIDYISASDSNGNVWLFEAYFPEKATIVKSCHDAVVGIEYDPNNNCLLIVTMKPKLHIVSI